MKQVKIVGEQYRDMADYDNRRDKYKSESGYIARNRNETKILNNIAKFDI